MLQINRLGLRDDETSLRAPAIIVTGDSIAMGWGSRQEETFPQLIEQHTGLTVLNAAVSSYGTVREMRLLDRLDVSNLRHLVIQYNENDWLENETFYQNGNHLPIMTEARFQEGVARAQQEKQYYVGKYTVESFRKIYERLTSRRPAVQRGSPPPTTREHAHRFLNAILHGTRVDLTHVRIIVFAIDSSGRNDASFIGALQQELASADYPAFLRNLAAVNLASRLTPDGQFVLDTHLNADGHRANTGALLEIITRDRNGSRS